MKLARIRTTEDIQHAGNKRSFDATIGPGNEAYAESITRDGDTVVLVRRGITVHFPWTLVNSAVPLVEEKRAEAPKKKVASKPKKATTKPDPVAALKARLGG